MSVGIIPTGQNVGAKHPLAGAHASASADELRRRWGSPEGQTMLADWQAAHFERALIERCVGQFHGKLDLRGVPLSGKDLSHADLSNCDCFAANLRNSKLVAAKLDGSYFSEADIRGCDLSWSSARDSFFDNVNFDKDTRLLGVPLHSVNFNLAALLFDQASTEQRIAHLRRRHPAFAFFLEWSCDYGRSLSRWTLWVVIATLAFSVAFYVARDQYTGLKTPVDAFYFALVTFSTLGFGDIVPTSAFARILTLADVAVGYVMGGLLVAILARRVLGN